MKFKKLAALMAVMTMVASFSVVNVSAETESAENETAAEETVPVLPDTWAAVHKTSTKVSVRQKNLYLLFIVHPTFRL